MRQLHTLLLRKRAKGPLRTVQKTVMPPNLVASFSAVSPHLSPTAYLCNKHWDLSVTADHGGLLNENEPG